MLTDQPEAVERLLSGDGGLASRMTEALNGYLGDEGRLAAKRSSLDARVKMANADQVNLDRRMDQVRAGLERQFNALDTLVGQMTSTSSFLNAQLSRLL